MLCANNKIERNALSTIFFNMILHYAMAKLENESTILSFLTVTLTIVKYGMLEKSKSFLTFSQTKICSTKRSYKETTKTSAKKPTTKLINKSILLLIS